MLVYISAPYSSAIDKDDHMKFVMRCIGAYMVANPGEFAVSPLCNHYALNGNPALGTDWTFWKDYSFELLNKCEKMVVLVMHGTDTSVGVHGEVTMAKELGIPVFYLPVA